MSGLVRHAGSFRDPAGFLYRQDGGLFRHINASGLADFDRFERSGLAAELLAEKKLVPYRTVRADRTGKVLELEELPFVTYPYEWSFRQLRDAALLTLELARRGLEHGLMLKDASAFNVAFRDGRPIFLDHTSFMICRENTPWPAYRQFVMHFLAPLLVMKYTDMRCLGLLRENLGGISPDFAGRLLPRRTWFSFTALAHVHLHAVMERKYSSQEGDVRQVGMKPERLRDFLRALADETTALKPPVQRTDWEAYYRRNSYSDAAFAAKQEAVRKFCAAHPGGVTVDLGANTGVFSEIAAEHSETVIAADIDPQSVEMLYETARTHCPKLQPVLQDLANPSPAVGVFNAECAPFLARCKGDKVLGLALIHHLRITGNWDLERIVRLFAGTAPHALVEFVPADDVQVKRLVRGRDAIYADWNAEQVEAAFRAEYPVLDRIALPDSGRILFAMHKAPPTGTAK